MTSLRVRGVVRRRNGTPLLVLSHRLDGHDTFLRAELALDPDGQSVRVRVHTFDDVTVLQPTVDAPLPTDTWAGRLRLPRKRRSDAIPDDLATALAAAGTDLDHVDERERRHLLGYLADAADPALRRSRISTIVAGLSA